MDTILARAEPTTIEPTKRKKPNIQRAKARMKDLIDKRRDYEQRWKSIRDYQLAWIGHFEDTADETNPARRRDKEMLSNVAWLANQVFAAGVMSGLTPPSRQWFKFGFSNSYLANDIEALKVLDERQEIVSAWLSKSNFYNCIFQNYMELAAGQAPIGIFKSNDGIRFQPYTLGTYYLDVSAAGIVNTFARKYKMSAAQLAEQFGEDKLPRNIQAKLKTSAKWDKKYTVNWLVEPNDGVKGIKNTDLPYRSLYWLEKENTFLDVGGFHEFPVLVGRYYTKPNEAYAIGAAWFAEGDVKQHKRLKEDYLRAVALSVKPPMKTSPNVYNKGVSLKPGGITITDNSQTDVVEPLFNVGINLQDLQAEIMRLEESIKRIYSADLFLLLDSIDKGQMTAREVMERQQEKLQQLGPVVERLQFEYLSPIIERVYNILERANMFPPIPPQVVERLGNADVKIEYISPLAQAQKMSGLVNIEQAVSFAAQMSQIYPETLQSIDALGAINRYFDMLGAPAAMRRSKDEAEERIQQQQQQAMQQQAAEQTIAAAQAAAPVAQAAKNITEAANDGNPALAAWLGMNEI